MSMNCVIFLLCLVLILYFADILNEMRHQYNVLYRPDPLLQDGKYHAVDIRVRAVGDTVVRARQGYYAPRAGSR